MNYQNIIICGDFKVLNIKSIRQLGYPIALQNTISVAYKDMKYHQIIYSYQIFVQ